MSNDRYDDFIKLAAHEGGKAGVEAYKKEKEKDRKKLFDKRYQNIELLLKNYRDLKKHAENAIYTAEQAEDAIDILDLMWDPHNKSATTVESIKSSLLKTKIMVSHIDNAIATYRDMAYRSKNEVEIRRFEVLYDWYIDEEKKSAIALCDKFHISRRAFYYDLETAEKRLTTLIFGIEHLEKRE